MLSINKKDSSDITADNNPRIIVNHESDLDIILTDKKVVDSKDDQEINIINSPNSSLGRESDLDVHMGSNLNTEQDLLVETKPRIKLQSKKIKNRS
jgi:hypothetical protein